MTRNSFDARARLDVDGSAYEIYRLDRIAGSARLPYSLKVLLENLLRREDGVTVTADQIDALAAWDPAADHGIEIQFAQPACSYRTSPECRASLTLSRCATRSSRWEAIRRGSTR